MKYLTQAEYDDLIAARDERDRLHRLINTPETLSFFRGAVYEASHQIDRWGTVHDRAKKPADWFWLLGYLSGKALAAHVDGDVVKAMHHTISSAAVLAHWHSAIKNGPGAMTPGASDLQRDLAKWFGNSFETSDFDAEVKEALASATQIEAEVDAASAALKG